MNKLILPFLIAVAAMLSGCFEADEPELPSIRDSVDVRLTKQDALFLKVVAIHIKAIDRDIVVNDITPGTDLCGLIFKRGGREYVRNNIRHVLPLYIEEGTEARFLVTTARRGQDMSKCHDSIKSVVLDIESDDGEYESEVLTFSLDD